MATAKTPLRRIESVITEEHLEIRAVLERLQTMTDPYMMLLVYKDLQNKLDAHFQNEEGEEGLYAVVEEVTENHSERVDALLDEHQVLLTKLTGLIKQCNELLIGPFAKLKTDTGKFIEMLQAHDIAETEILTDAILHEPGPSHSHEH